MNFTARNIEQAHQLENEIPLYPERGAVADQWTEFNGEVIVRNVVAPTLIPIRPPEGVVPRNESVIVAPGGGMLVLAMDHEGLDVARGLAAKGYTAYVLKYRVNSTPPNADAFVDACQLFYTEKMSAGYGAADAYLNTTDAVQDLIKAAGLVRSKVQGSDHKLHFIGFSAGAKVGIDALTWTADGDLFSSMGLIYFSMAKFEFKGSHLPKLFSVLTHDDPLFSRGGFELLRQWQECSESVEFHFFKSGGHGFGVRQQGTTSDSWFDLYTQWLLNEA